MMNDELKTDPASESAPNPGGEFLLYTTEYGESRVKSPRGTQFRRWATERLNVYLVKGFTMDDQRLKEAGGGRYFEELLQRIRDIRSSEKVFWRKVLDIFATSIDYSPNTETSKEFFAKIQNQLHWAAHGHTAAEKHRRPVGVLDGRRGPTGARRVRRRAAPSNQIIHQRADASLPNIGVTNLPKPKAEPRSSPIPLAKRYTLDVNV